MKCLKKIVLMAACSLSLQAQIKDYEFIRLSDYKGSDIPEYIHEITADQQIMVICKNGKMAKFKGIKISENGFLCKKANKLAKQMSNDDKQKVYVRKFNGKVQLWKFKD